jgi:DNA-binding transcriptional regulator LsrR (DeoR family)
VPEFVFDPRPAAATFVAAVGGIRRGLAGMSPNRPIDQLAELYNGVAKHLTGPAIAGTEEIAQALTGDPAIARTLNEAAAADIAVLGLGPVAGTVALLEQGEITPFDRDGQPVDDAWNRRVVGLTLDQISRIPTRVVAAGGPEKAEAILAAIRGRLVSVLITDEHVAKALLEQSQPPPASRAKAPRSGGAG